MDLIDRKIALEILKELHGEQVVSKYFTHEQCQRTRNGILMAYNEIHSMPTVDVESVVRCKDCYLHGNCSTEDVFVFAKVNNPYCCVGKLKDGE